MMAELILLTTKDTDVVRFSQRDEVALVKLGYAYAPSVDARPIGRACVTEDPFALDIARETRMMGGDARLWHHNIACLRSSDEDWT